MQKKYICLLLILFLASCLFVNDSNSPLSEQYITFKLSFKDSIETLIIVDSSLSSLNGATYFNGRTSQYTNIRLQNGNDNIPNFLSISFPSYHIGKYNWLDRPTYILIQKDKDELPPLLFPISGQTNVTIYETIGGKVEGNFNGIVRKAFSRDTINISGEFSVQRLDDNYPDL